MHPGSRGVTMPSNQGRPMNEGPSNTVVNVMSAQFVIVEYFDAQGRRHRDTFLKAGEEYYSTPNSEAWTNDLKSVRPWLKAGIEQKIPVSSVAKITDSVQILVGAEEETES
jgi:hypothetical protein